MTTTKSTFNRVLAHLRRRRDELNLQVHLAWAEARDEWRKLQRRWVQLKPKLNAAGSEALNTGGNVLAALGLSVEELRKGYERIRKVLR